MNLSDHEQEIIWPKKISPHWFKFIFAMKLDKKKNCGPGLKGQGFWKRVGESRQISLASSRTFYFHQISAAVPIPRGCQPSFGKSQWIYSIQSSCGNRPHYTHRGGTSRTDFPSSANLFSLEHTQRHSNRWFIVMFSL